MNSSPSLQAITQTLIENIARIEYGETSVSLKVHAGRVVSVAYSMTENNRKIISGREGHQELNNGGNA